MPASDKPFPRPVLRLADWSSLVLSLNWVYESPVPPDGQGKRSNPDLSAWLLLRGSVRVRFKGRAVLTAAAGDWVLLPVGERVQNFSEDAVLLSVCWKANWPDGRALFDHGLPVVVASSSFPALRDVAEKLLDFSRTQLQDDPLPTWRLRASVRVAAETFLESKRLLLEWQQQVIRVLAAQQVYPSLHEVPDERVLLALEHLDYLPLRHAVKVDKVASQVGLSTSQLNRLFARYLGHTPKAHLHLRRISEARHLLQSGDMPVKEVAYQVGFSSQSAFCHWFTQQVGCTPTRFAKQQAPPGDGFVATQA